MIPFTSNKKADKICPMPGGMLSGRVKEGTLGGAGDILVARIFSTVKVLSQ